MLTADSLMRDIKQVYCLRRQPVSVGRLRPLSSLHAHVIVFIVICNTQLVLHTAPCMTRELWNRPDCFLVLDGVQGLRTRLVSLQCVGSMPTAVLATGESVCPSSVCPPSYSGVLSRQMKLRSCGFHRRVGQSS